MFCEQLSSRIDRKRITAKILPEQCVYCVLCSVQRARYSLFDELSNDRAIFHRSENVIGNAKVSAKHCNTIVNKQLNIIADCFYLNSKPHCCMKRNQRV